MSFFHACLYIRILQHKQIVWHWVNTIEKVRVDVRIVFVLLASRIVLDIQKLISKVVGVSYAMFVISAVPYLARGLLACREGVSRP
jgi:hypothetical protein